MEILELLKSNNIEDEILGWRIAAESLNIEDMDILCRDMKEYRRKANRSTGNTVYTLIFDSYRITLGSEYSCIINYWSIAGTKCLDFRKNT